MLVDVIDTETCGLEGGVVELAVVTVDLENQSIVHWASSLVKPDRPIGFEAMAVHHITEAMVEKAKPLAEVIKLVVQPYVVAHNAAFDRKMVSPLLDDRTWACTLRTARHKLVEAPSYSNQVLRYWLGLFDLNFPVEAGEASHRALYDAWVTAHLLLKLAVSWEELVTLTSEPTLLKVVKFGKHKGQPWSEVPKSYLKYLIDEQFSDMDVIYTAKYYLERG